MQLQILKFLFRLDGMLIHRPTVPVYAPGWGGALRKYKCLALDHNTVPPVRVRTWARADIVQHANSDTTASSFV